MSTVRPDWIEDMISDGLIRNGHTDQSGVYIEFWPAIEHIDCTELRQAVARLFPARKGSNDGN